MTGPFETRVNGANERFHTTHWSIIYAVRTADEQRQSEIIGDLTMRYWQPVYCYLRRKGFRDSVAKDMTQGFFCDIVIGRELVRQADQTKGRFRTLLLTALERYLVSVHRTSHRQKRRPEMGVKQLDSDTLSDLVASQKEMKPEEVFYYTWAMNLLDIVLAEVKEEYCSTDRAAHWEVFWLRIVAPIIENAEAPSYAEICTKFGMESESRASNMAVTVKRRFRAILKRHLRDLVPSDNEVDDELGEVFAILSRAGAG